MSHSFLDHLPDWTHWSEAQEWISSGQRLISSLGKVQLTDQSFASLDWGQVSQQPQLPFGLYPSAVWRKFALAVFLADLVSYPAQKDQVNFERLLFVMHTFPQGFRTWWFQSSDGKWWPVGYTGWYPMFETVFDTFEKSPHQIRDRMVAPDTYSLEQRPFLYLFNYSAAPAFEKSLLTKQLMQTYSQDIQSVNPRGMSCITVSESGIRVAKRFGMSCVGQLNIPGPPESIFLKRF